jgi:ribosome biogenesis GTPase
MKGKTTVLAGPSGVGKSTFINIVQPKANMETGDISEKIKRGKHTTRHSELIYIEEGTYIMDTPGFSSLYIDEIEKDELKDYFVEFREYEGQCRFIGCNHLNEPHCAVKEALKEKKINKLRYDDYVILYEELKNQKRY